MKIQAESQSQEDIELHAQKQVEKKTVLIGSTFLTPGHRCFEINTKTLKVEEAQYEREVHFNAADRRKIITKEGYAYVTALNKKNALKRFKRGY